MSPAEAPAARLTPRLRAAEPPRAPRLALARGEVVSALAERLLALDDKTLDGLTAAATDGYLAVVAPADRLPWVDGLAYLAPFPDAPALYLPTHLEPDVPPTLVARAFARQLPDPPGPIAWWVGPDGGQVLLRLAGLATPGRLRLAELAQLARGDRGTAR